MRRRDSSGRDKRRQKETVIQEGEKAQEETAEEETKGDSIIRRDSTYSNRSAVRQLKGVAAPAAVCCICLLLLRVEGDVTSLLFYLTHDLKLRLTHKP